MRKPSDAMCVLSYSEPSLDMYGDEYLQHFVCFGDDDGLPIEPPYWEFSSAGKADEYAESLADKYGLEYVPDLIWE